jgi:hypothetical protein
VSIQSDFSKEHVIRAYNKYNQDVIDRCPPEKLLVVFEITDGWEPLCKFLGKPVPNVPFPHVNDVEEHKRAIGKIKKILLPRPLLQSW